MGRAKRRARKPQRLVATRVATLGEGAYTDPGQTGLQLLVRKKRGGFSRTWLLRYKFKRSENRIVLGHFPETTLDQARGEARKYREIASQGIDPMRARPRRRTAQSLLPASAAVALPSAKHTIEFLVSEFVERWLKPHRRRPEYAVRILNADVLPHWRGRDARTIEPNEVIDLLDKVVDRGAPVMANRVAAILTQLFKFAIHRQIVKSSPVQLLIRPGGDEKARDRALTDDELKAFLRNPKAATRYARLAHAMTILLLTGQRRGELALARWADVDLKAATWAVPPEHSKTGRGHVVPLSEWAVAEFRALKALAKRSAFVLPAGGDDRDRPIDPKQLTRGVARCQDRMAELGIGEFTMHDLRRTCRTGLARLKIQPHIAERVLAHAQEKIAGTYDQWEYIDEKRDALEKWSAHLEALRS